MPYFDFIWEETEFGNVEYISQHGLSTEDVEQVVLDPEHTTLSRSSGRPIAFGHTHDGRYIAVVYELVNDCTVYPVTAYPIED
jgi:uncharacterized DUF497 family protein